MDVLRTPDERFWHLEDYDFDPHYREVIAADGTRVRFHFVDDRETWAFLETWTKPFLTVFGSADPVSFKPGAHLKFQRKVPGAAGQPHRVIDGANHFIQEDAPDELVEIIDTFVHQGANP